MEKSSLEEKQSRAQQPAGDEPVDKKHPPDERAKNWTAAVLAGVLCLPVVATLPTSIPTAYAQLGKLKAEADLAKKKAEAPPAINVEVDAHQLPSKDHRWILVELTLSNSGNDAVAVDLAEGMTFTLSRVTKITPDGRLGYENPSLKLQFDYPDTTVTLTTLRPGGSPGKYRTVQEVSSPGLYLVRFRSAKSKTATGPGALEDAAQSFVVVE
jgi:hypothetical protein